VLGFGIFRVSVRLFSYHSLFFNGHHHALQARVWDCTTGKCINVLAGHTDQISALDFAPNGATVATASKDHTVRIFNVKVGNCLQVLKGHKHYVSSVVFAQAKVDFGGKILPSKLTYEPKHKLDLRAATKDKAEVLKMKMDLKKQQYAIKRMVATFVKTAALTSAKQMQGEARDHHHAEQAMSLRVAKSQVARAKQIHHESMERRAAEQARNNQELKEASLEMREYAKAVKFAQETSDRERIQELAQIQEEERANRVETRRLLAEEKARQLAAVQEEERKQKLATEAFERTTRMKAEQQAREIQEKTDAGRQVRAQKDADRKEAQRLYDLRQKEAAVKMRALAAEEAATEKAAQKERFKIEKVVREANKAAADRERTAKAEKERMEADAQRAAAKEALFEATATKKAEQQAKKDARLLKAQRGRENAEARARQREKDLIAKSQYELEMTKRLAHQTEVNAAKQKKEREAMMAAARADGDRQIRNMKKLFPLLNVTGGDESEL
jgi:hypothetical protein